MIRRPVDWFRVFNGFMLAVVVVSLFTAGILVKRKLENRTARIQEVTDALVKLKKDYGLAKQDAKSQHELMDRIRGQNKDLAEQLDKAGARIQNLITIKTRYKKENRDLKAKQILLTRPSIGTDRASFSQEFDLATVRGYFEAGRIENPKGAHLELIPKEQEQTVAVTNQGAVIVPKPGATVTLNVKEAKRAWWDGLGVMAGGDAGPGGGSGMLGVDWRGWGVYVRAGSSGQSVGILRRWTLGGRK